MNGYDQDAVRRLAEAALNDDHDGIHPWADEHLRDERDFRLVLLVLGSLCAVIIRDSLPVPDTTALRFGFDLDDDDAGDVALERALQIITPLLNDDEATAAAVIDAVTVDALHAAQVADNMLAVIQVARSGIHPNNDQGRDTAAAD